MFGWPVGAVFGISMHCVCFSFLFHHFQLDVTTAHLHTIMLLFCANVVFWLFCEFGHSFLKQCLCFYHLYPSLIQNICMVGNTPQSMALFQCIKGTVKRVPNNGLIKLYSYLWRFHNIVWPLSFLKLIMSWFQWCLKNGHSGSLSFPFWLTT